MNLRLSLRSAHGRNLMWLMLERALYAVAGVFIGTWIAKHLGPSTLGSMAAVLAITAAVLPFASFSLDALVVRECARAPSNRQSVLGTAFVMRLAGGSAAALATIALVWTSDMRGELSWIAVAALCVPLLLQAFDVFDLWFQSQLLNKKAISARLISLTAISTARIVAVQADAGVETFAILTGAESLITAIALWAYYRHTYGEFKLSLDWRRAVALGREAFPLVIAGIAVGSYQRLSQIMLHEFSGGRALGLYAAVTPIAEGANALVHIIYVVAAPMFAQPALFNSNEGFVRLERVLRLLVYVTLGYSLLVFAAAPVIVGLLLGPSYEGAVPVLRVQSASAVFVALGVGTTLYLTNRQLPHLALYRTTLGAATTLLVGFLLIPRWDAIGCALSILIGQIAAAFLFTPIISKRLFLMQLRAFMPRMS